MGNERLEDEWIEIDDVKLYCVTVCEFPAVEFSIFSVTAIFMSSVMLSQPPVPH